MQFSHKKPTNGRTIKEAAASFLKDTIPPPKVFERHGSRARGGGTTTPKLFFRRLLNGVCLVLCI